MTFRAKYYIYVFDNNGVNYGYSSSENQLYLKLKEAYKKHEKSFSKISLISLENGKFIEHSLAEFIALVPTPRLRYIDHPYQEDELLFEQNLRKSLQQQIDAASRCAQIDLSPIQDKIDTYTWTGIFKKVKEIYLKCNIQ